MKLTILLIIAIAATASATNFYSTLAETEKKALFHDFVQRHNKAYDSVDEFRVRYNVFSDNLLRIDEMNAHAAGTSATFGINAFADLTREEFTAQRLMPREALASTGRPVTTDEPMADDDSGSVDWRTKVGQYMNGVRNQGQCGSCWAFSTAENVASVWAIAGNQLVETSVQQIVDCDNVDQGCNGGDPPTAYKYIIQNGGLETVSSYGPYQGVDGQCHAKPSLEVAKISSWKYITGSGDDNDSATSKMKAGVTVQPLSICVEADTWQFYTGGVLSSNCGQQLDHCVILAGWSDGSSGSNPYWIVRNSWGTDWGVQGYIYIEIGQNLCGIQNEVTTAIV